MRVIERLDELYALGDRIGYSAEEDEAHRLAAGWMREAGLEVSVDEAGNLHGRRRRGARLERLAPRHRPERRPLRRRARGRGGDRGGGAAACRASSAVVAFRAEENGPMGSRRLSELPEAFVELHIEQGPVLGRAGEPLGVVTAIAGQARGAVVFDGRADHAGTTPMDVRRDALVDAARFVLHVRDCPRDGAVATVGAVEVEPNAGNVVPARVTVAVDARAPTAAQLDELVAAIGFEPTWQLEPTPMSGRPYEALCELLPDAPRLVSGAGHDAMVLGAAGVPTAMLFVRSLNGGVSHSPDELTSDEDVALAVDALTSLLASLA